MTQTLLMTALLAVAPAPVTEDAASAADLAAMQGDWMVVSIVASGMKIPEDEAQALFRTVAGDTYEVSRFSKVVGQGTFKIDATKTPKTIDSTPAGQADQTKTIQGIYEFDGRRLKVCNAMAGKPRPVNFEAPFGSGHTSIIWEPEKDSL